MNRVQHLITFCLPATFGDGREFWWSWVCLALWVAMFLSICVVFVHICSYMNPCCCIQSGAKRYFLILCVHYIQTGDKLKRHQQLCYAVYLFCCHGLSPLVHLEGRVTANRYKILLNDHLYPKMKHFYPDANGLFRDDSDPHPHGPSAQMVWWGWKWCNSYAFPFTTFQPSWTPMRDFGSLHHLFKTPTEGISFWRTVFIHPTQFVRLVELMPRCIESIHATHDEPDTHISLDFLFICQPSVNN